MLQEIQLKFTPFSNHDTQGIDRQSFDIVERTELSPGAEVGAQQYPVDGSTAPT